ncbi:MAG TPA: hypothetical protein VME66_06355, partial [Candidatus Acidoferrales bacterium]|nr:hypothetical protein [Candidatus Acidoferrales bacterium]
MKLSAGSKLCSAALLILLQACSGGNTSSGVAAGPPTPHADGTSAQATATFEIEIPLPTSASPLSSSARRPSYVSAATQSVKISVLTVNGTPPSGLAPTVANVTPTSNGCTVDAAQPGDYTCTIAAIVPAGSDSLEVSLFSSPGAAGSLLAQQITPVTINPGVANNVSAVLDADPGAITVTATANTGISGTQAAGFVTAGTIAQTLTIHVADKAGDLIGPALPGAPTLTAGSSVPTVASVSANTAAGTLSITPGTAFGSTTITVTANPATTTSGLTASATTFTVNNEPLIAAGGCAPSCSASLLAYGSGVFTTYGTLPAASFGSKEISAFGFDGNDTLYVADEPGDSTEGFLEFGNAEFDVPTPPTAPAPALTLTDANDLDGVTGFDVTREGTLSIANAGLNGSAPTNQFEAYAPGASAPELGMNFGSNAFGEAVAAMPSATGTIQGYAVALFNELSNTGSVGVVIPGGSGATCDSATSASVPCGLIPLGSADDVFADGSFDLVWDRADQALIVADYDATTNDYSLVQLDWNGSSFGAPIVLPVP